MSQLLSISEKSNVAVQSTCPGFELCRPFVQCSAQILPDEARAKLCSLEGGSTGVCCKEISKLEGSNSILRVPDVGPRAPAISLSNAVVMNAIDMGESFLKNVTQLMKNSITVKGTKSPESQHAMFTQASPGVNEGGRLCLLAMEIARNLGIAAGSEFFLPGSYVSFVF